MKLQLALLTLFFHILSLSMEYTPSVVSNLRKRKLSAEEVISLATQETKLLKPTNTSTSSKTPKLDEYKCAFILGHLKPTGLKKIYRKIPNDIGALVAQKKHLGKKLSLKEELELWKWNLEMEQKYLTNSSKRD